MPRQADTKQRILDRADTLMRSRGYTGFSYKDIALDLDIRNAAIHYHFPAKEDLGVAVIAQDRRRFARWINRQVIREMDTQGKLHWYFSIYTHYMEDGRRLCLPGSVASSYYAMPESIQNEARALIEDIHDWLKSVLQEGRDRDAIDFYGDTDAKATAIMGSIQGALQLTRLTGGDQLHSAIEQIQADLFR